MSEVSFSRVAGRSTVSMRGAFVAGVRDRGESKNKGDYHTRKSQREDQYRKQSGRPLGGTKSFRVYF